MKKFITIALTSMVFYAGGGVASPLTKQIEDFIAQQQQSTTSSITINYLNSIPSLDCTTPLLALVTKNRVWGKVTLVAQCANKKTFMQLDIHVTGNYVIARQPIAAGDEISFQNISLQSGRLDLLPNATVTHPEQIVQYIALRNIATDQPIRLSMLRKNWLVKAGQSVKVMIIGEGYQVVTNGKPLTNGGLGDTINIRVNQGKIIEGIVTPEGVRVAPLDLYQKNN